MAKYLILHYNRDLTAYDPAREVEAPNFLEAVKQFYWKNERWLDDGKASCIVLRVVNPHDPEEANDFRWYHIGYNKNWPGNSAQWVTADSVVRAD